VAKRVKGWTESIGDEAEPIALCDSLPSMMIVMEASWILAPSFS
jgi:hypothetical protein